MANQFHYYLFGLVSHMANQLYFLFELVGNMADQLLFLFK